MINVVILQILVRDCLAFANRMISTKQSKYYFAIRRKLHVDTDIYIVT